MSAFYRYQQAVDFLQGLSNLPQKNYMRDQSDPSIYLKRMEYFLELLNHPERGFNYIHVTGTAGKGSVTNLLHEILLADGKRVGSFTSPTVTSLIEAIRVNNLFIAPDEFANLLTSIKPLIDEAYRNSPYGGPSAFEIQLALGFLYFKKMKCEWVVLEVGMGGAYDATNVISDPKVTVITNIDYDHTNLLGKKLTDIARVKAGVIKKECHFFTSEQRPSLLKFLRSQCIKEGATFHAIKTEDNHSKNHALVKAIAQHIGIKMLSMTKGIKKHQLPCRFEIVQKNPQIILDGAHNPRKMRYTMDQIQKLRYRNLWVIVSISADKDCVAILREITPHADQLIFTRFQTTERTCADPYALAASVKRSSGKTNIFLDPRDALKYTQSQAKKDDLILVTGSFFLTGELRKEWIPEELVLRIRQAFKKK